MPRPADHATRLSRARAALECLSVGDAFGERFFGIPGTVERLIELRALPSAPWDFTDDTVMAISIVDVLEEHGGIQQDRLAELFAARYRLDPRRGYGATAHGILEALCAGEDWRGVSAGAFGGMGSMGNGGAMRSGPIGAYFAGDYGEVVLAARLSAEVTHAHVEGQAGAIAVALAVAWAVQGDLRPAELFRAVLDQAPESETLAGIRRAASLPLDYDVRTAVSALGNGSGVVSQDTVPFALWCAARHLGQFEEALWTTVSGLGDRDTTCAIVGCIVGMSAGATVPADWLAAREPLPRMDRSLLRA